MGIPPIPPPPLSGQKRGALRGHWSKEQRLGINFAEEKKDEPRTQISL